MATRREIVLRIASAIEPLYGEAEARQIAEMVVLECGNISRNQLLIEPNEELEILDLDRIISELSAWRPVQYVISREWFDDMALEVGEGVLIPRPETEELVAWIASQEEPTAHVLDVGTGSGCIAIALRRRLHRGHVWAMDISSVALEIARRNAMRYAPDVEFIEGDALADFSQLFATKLDVVVSNPPYIPRSDVRLMRPNVTDYEPQLALFVDDDDPLKFYRAIARTSRKLLRDGGRLYFEIYEQFAGEMVDMLISEGYSDIVVKEDFRQKPRMICAVKSL